MKVLWIEDFGGGLEADVTTLKSLFVDLLGKEVLDGWSPETDLIGESRELQRFCSDHSLLHEVNLVKNFGEFLEFEKTRGAPLNSTDDIVVIDINLSERGMTGTPDGYDPGSFHKKAGFYIFNYLIRQGFDPKNICLLTGEMANTFVEFVDHCTKAMIPIPEAFLKDSSGYGKFRNWLAGRCQRPYLILRRGILDGCEWLKNESISLRYRSFCKGDESGILGDPKTYLDTLAALLPQREPEPARQWQVFNVFIRALAHIWEDKASPLNYQFSRIQDEDKSLAINFGWIMKNLRNWGAHESRIGEFSIKDVAFFFLVNMRTVFRLPKGENSPKDVLPFEAQLLSLFEATDLKDEQVRDILYESYAEAKNKLVEAILGKKPKGSAEFKTPRDAIAFNKIVANLRDARVDVDDPRFFIRALVLHYWHGFCQVYSNQIPKKWDSGTKSKFFKAEFSWNFDLYRYEENAFQRKFSKHMFKYSFPSV